MPDRSTGADRRIAIIGLGHMGLPMARRLLAAGFAVGGSDLDADARRHLAEAGGEPSDSPSAAVRDADIVILMLPDSNIVETVIEALDGSLAAGTLLIDMGSSEPLRTRAIAERLAASGVQVMDAPVSGGVRGATEGTLTVMVGGSAEDIARSTEVLTALGRVVHAGPVGAGHAVKALNNLLSATHFWATAEAVDAGRRFGIEPAVLIDVVNGSSGRSGSSEGKWPNFVLTNSFDSGFAAALMAKDMRIAVQLAQQLGAPSALAERATELWTDAAADLGRGADHTLIATWVAEHPGGGADH